MSKIIAVGKRLRFRQAEERDLPYIMSVEFAPENARYVIPYPLEQHRLTLETEEAVHLVVETLTGKPVGFLMIAGLTNPAREIEFTRIIIDVKGCGYGKETLSMLKAWAFEDLNYHRAWLDCKADNERALHVYEGAGLVKEGLLRDTLFLDGRYESLYILAMLAQEYSGSQAM